MTTIYSIPVCVCACGWEVIEPFITKNERLKVAWPGAEIYGFQTQFPACLSLLEQILHCQWSLKTHRKFNNQVKNLKKNVTAWHFYVSVAWAGMCGGAPAGGRAAETGRGFPPAMPPCVPTVRKVRWIWTIFPLLWHWWASPQVNWIWTG